LICISCTHSSGAGVPSNVTSTFAACVGNGLSRVAWGWTPCWGPSPLPNNVTNPPGAIGPVS
jgi:hypothetical protein